MADDRKITDMELRHFTHALVLRYLKTKLKLDTGV